MLGYFDDNERWLVRIQRTQHLWVLHGGWINSQRSFSYQKVIGAVIVELLRTIDSDCGADTTAVKSLSMISPQF